MIHSQLQWYTLDLGNVDMHIMTEEMRVKYRLDELWLVGEADLDEFRGGRPLFVFSQLPLQVPTTISTARRTWTRRKRRKSSR